MERREELTAGEKPTRLAADYKLRSVRDKHGFRDGTAGYRNVRRNINSMNVLRVRLIY
jgi:hypothetical protein